MRIVCPACAAAYEVPENLVPADRRTRCAQCGETWTPSRDSAVEAAAVEVNHVEVNHVEVVEPREPPHLERLARVAPRPPAPARSAVWAGWLASLILLAALGWAGYAYRREVMQAWPPSARLYAAVGLASGPETTAR